MVEFALVAFGSAMAAAAVLVPLARRAALATDLVAEVRPDRAHTAPTPYGGGLALADTLTLVVGGAWLLGLYGPAEWLPGWLPGGLRTHLEARTPTLLRLAMGALVFFIIGLVDDRYRLPASAKLLFQAAGAALVVVGFGLSASVWIGDPSAETPAAWAAQAVSILWLLAVVNAWNLLDHADGVAAAAGVVAFGGLALAQMRLGEWFVPGVALATAGALAGFLIYNFPPARLFLGDAGSHLVGYLYGTLAMVARFYFPKMGTGRWVVLVPVVLAAVPLLDMACVLASRWRRGQAPWRGDATSHLAHRLRARGVGPAAIVATAAGMAVLAAAAGVLLTLPGRGAALALGPLALVAAWLAWARRPAEGTP